MREIKFRAKFRDENNYEFWFPLELIEHEKGIGSFLSISAEWEQLTPWEQFTGLHDPKQKNKEVYEGDIYKHCGLTKPITVENKHGYRFMFGLDQLYRAVIENGEYLGNIHENPELINE